MKFNAVAEWWDDYISYVVSSIISERSKRSRSMKIRCVEKVHLSAGAAAARRRRLHPRPGVERTRLAHRRLHLHRCSLPSPGPRAEEDRAVLRVPGEGAAGRACRTGGLDHGAGGGRARRRVPVRGPRRRQSVPECTAVTTAPKVECGRQLLSIPDRCVFVVFRIPMVWLLTGVANARYGDDT